jgi:acyl-[acyl carrier protein]--UDP-N-acetylglucosamine O-acyltransferase
MIHPTAIIEEGVELGENVKVWAFAHIRTGAKIGDNCVIGEGAHIDT